MTMLKDEVNAALASCSPLLGTVNRFQPWVQALAWYRLKACRLKLSPREIQTARYFGLILIKIFKVSLKSHSGPALQLA